MRNRINMFYSECRGTVRICQCGNRFPMGEIFQKALKNSADLLQAVWEKQETQVAEGIRLAHFETSQLQYNDENALSYTISLALYAARNFYTVYRELPGEKGLRILFSYQKKIPGQTGAGCRTEMGQNSRGCACAD